MDRGKQADTVFSEIKRASSMEIEMWFLKIRQEKKIWKCVTWLYHLSNTQHEKEVKIT